MYLLYAVKTKTPNFSFQKFYRLKVTKGNSKFNNL